MMKKVIKQINDLALKTTIEIAKKGSLKGVTKNDIDKLAESVELLNDLYEELYNNVFDESEVD
jgi:hypothetical protein